MTTDPSIHSFLILDAERSRGRTNPQRQILRDDIYAVLNDALRATDIEPKAVEDRGDGAMAVFDRPVLDVLDEVVNGLIDQLRKVNAQAAPPDWLRLRFAVHFGLVHQDPRGWSGAALDETFELNGLPPVKAMLRTADRSQCVLVVSDEVYKQVVCHRYRGLNPTVYRQVEHEGRVGWAMVPGYPAPPDPEPKPRPASLPPQSPPQTIGNQFIIETVQHIDARVSPSPAVTDE